MSWSFVLTSLVICVSPGIGALYTMAAGLARGTRAGLLAAFACTLGTVPHAVAALTAGSVRDRVLTRPALVTRIRKVFAASFLVLSARLAVQSR